MIVSKQWIVYPRAPESHFNKFPDIQKLIVQILYNRGIYLPNEVNEFIEVSHPFYDPFLMKDIQQAVEQILYSIENEHSIAVYGDYDADGVTATTLTIQALTALGAKVTAYIPNRFEEGYGLNKQAITELAQKGIDLIITVDCGIRSVEEVEYGNQLGLKFIITDHHSIPTSETGADIVPPAVAVVNPKQIACQYPFKGLAGVGVAYKLIQALRKTVSTTQSTSSGLNDDDLLDLVAIGTVADMVPLVEENRVIVKKGLALINNSKRAGLQALIIQSGLKLGRITAGSIGFTIGPRLNAAGRLTQAQTSYKLLSTTDMVEAEELAKKLHQININRQDMTQEFVDEAEAQINKSKTLAPIYLVTSPNFNEGVVGLVASRLTDKFYRPTLVAHQGETFTKGSGRSIPELDITQTLDQCADLLVKYGGHAAAAGFTIETKNLNRFRERLTEIATQTLNLESLQKTLLIDAKLNLRGVTHKLVNEIQCLQPFGYNNPTPKFTTPNLIVNHHSLVGREKNHLKLKLFDGKGIWDAIGFNMGQSWPYIERSSRVDVVYTLEFNVWNGQTNLQLNLKDLKIV